MSPKVVELICLSFLKQFAKISKCKQTDEFDFDRKLKFDLNLEDSILTVFTDL